MINCSPQIQIHFWFSFLLGNWCNWLAKPSSWLPGKGGWKTLRTASRWSLIVISGASCQFEGQDRMHRACSPGPRGRAVSVDDGLVPDGHVGVENVEGVTAAVRLRVRPREHPTEHKQLPAEQAATVVGQRGDFSLGLEDGAEPPLSSLDFLLPC